MLVLFDFDGTLADTAPDLAFAANLQRARAGLPDLEASAYRAHASQGARGMLRIALGLAPEDPGFEAARQRFLDDYARHMTRATTLFPGIADLLTRLDDAGHAWGIVTNKMESLALPIIAHLGLAEACAVAVGGDTTPHAKPHPEPLLYAARTAGYAPEQCVHWRRRARHRRRARGGHADDCRGLRLLRPCQCRRLGGGSRRARPARPVADVAHDVVANNDTLSPNPSPIHGRGEHTRERKPLHSRLMTTQLLVFLAASFTLLTLSRAALMLWQRQRVCASGTPWKVLLGGLRIDALTLAALLVLPLLCAPWVGTSPMAQRITGVWLTLAWVLLCLMELSTPQFLIEYDTRPNRLYLVYLKHPKEVCGMLWQGYRALLFAVLVGMAALVWLGARLWFAPPYASWQSASVLVNILLTLAAAALCTLAVRGTLQHRPINPSTVAFCGDAMVNALALNSLYSALYAAYSLKNERSSADMYGDLPQTDVYVSVCQGAALPAPGALDPHIPTLHAQHATTTPTRPRHIVLIVEESLGAQFVGHLNGKSTQESLTPELDKLADAAWTFTRAYATGTRSVRGLEALACGFPPCYSEAALKLPDAQARFFTLAQLLKPQGYRTAFVYGGEAHFDNMQGFFLGNGFSELYDRKTFENPAFVGTWGVSDEDMFGRVHALLQSAQDPCLILAFSVSNHTPWEYPAGRIQPLGDPKTVENTVRYADWAIGQFFDRARRSPYWDDTVFLVAADHDARVGGQSHVPLKHFHIPALILGGGITPRRDDRRVSQIDFPVTLLSLAGVSCAHPMIGHDLTLAHTGGRAMMQYNENYGYWQGDVLTVLQPHKPAVQFRHTAPDVYQPVALDAALAHTALAHALWPGLAYRARQYTLPQLRLPADTLESRP